MLLCPVRGCHLALAREERRAFCERGHSFDYARSGYLNLLQPQDRRSRLPGDTLLAVAARRRLHDRGITQPLFDAVARAAQVTSADSVLDAGCGEGFYVGKLAEQTGCSGHGVDISISAIQSAAQRYPACEWIVANADRFIPYADRSFSLVMSITARMNEAEFRRVLKPDGRLLIALPAADDLIELRGAGRDRIERTIETFAGSFKLQSRTRVTTSTELDSDGIADILHSVYRPAQTKAVAGMNVTLSLDLLIFGL